jgi:hypothetical protein
LTEAPQQITLRFAPGVQFDLATDASRSNVASSIKFVRAGHDNAFVDIQDVSVMPLPNAPSGTAPAGLIGGRPAGSVTVGDAPNGNEIVIRFASTLPDDLYRVTIEPGLKSTTGDTLASRVEFDVRLSLGAFVKAVVPQPVARGASGLTQSRQEVHVYFNENDALAQSSAQDFQGRPRICPRCYRRWLPLPPGDRLNADSRNPTGGFHRRDRRQQLEFRQRMVAGHPRRQRHSRHGQD